MQPLCRGQPDPLPIGSQFEVDVVDQPIKQWLRGRSTRQIDQPDFTTTEANHGALAAWTYAKVDGFRRSRLKVEQWLSFSHIPDGQLLSIPSMAVTFPLTRSIK